MVVGWIVWNAVEGKGVQGKAVYLSNGTNANQHSVLCVPEHNLPILLYLFGYKTGFFPSLE